MSEKEEKPTPVEAKKVFLTYPPVIQPIVIEKTIFEEPTNKYGLYQHLVETDIELWGAIHTASVLTAKCLAGFQVKAGKELEEEEEDLLERLKEFEPFLKAKAYDIAFHLLQDGNAVYAIEETNNVGITNLVYLPMTYLTCIENEEQLTMLEAEEKKRKRGKVSLEALKKFLAKTQIFERGIYILNEWNPTLRQTFKSSDTIHFDYGRQEEVTDNVGRYTLGVWNTSPLHALRAKILWKHSLIINDMLWRDRMVPREHHKLPSAMFDPDKFEGATYEDRVAAARSAAETYLKDYAKKLTQETVERRLRPDQGYVTFEGVEIVIVEPKIQYTSPNEMLDQIDKSIPAATGTSESAITGKPTARGSFASEIAVGAYIALKAEHLAEVIIVKFIELGKRHIKKKYPGKYDAHLDKVNFKITKILEKHQLIRDAAILSELPFTDSEIRAILDYPPLTGEQMKEITERRHRYTETGKEAAATAKRRRLPERPLTPASKEQRQIT